MDCFVTSARKSFFHRHSTCNNGAADPQDPFLRLFKRILPRSSTTELHEEPLEAGPSKRRRAAMAFLLGCYLCGKARVSDGGDEDMKGDFRFVGELGGTEEDGIYMASAKKRRKLSCNKWTDLYIAPTRLKRLLRKIRGKLRKLRHFHHSTSFHYDPLSYAMNFDDGCWQHCDSHGKLYCRFPSPHCSDGNLQKKSQVEAPTSSARPLWQRRRVAQPKSLKVKKVRAC